MSFLEIQKKPRKKRAHKLTKDELAREAYLQEVTNSIEFSNNKQFYIYQEAMRLRNYSQHFRNKVISGKSNRNDLKAIRELENLAEIVEKIEI